MNTFQNLPNILKEAKHSQQNIGFSLIEAKKELENAIKIRSSEQENLRKLSMERSRLQRSLCSLDSLIPNLQTNLSAIEQKNKDLALKIDHITWKQSKAEFIANSEKKMCEKKQAQVNEFINEKENPSFTIPDKKEEEKQREIIKTLCKKRDALAADLDEIINHTAEIDDLTLKVEQENKILQKRNSALLLRLQRLLKETESRRDEILDKIKQVKIINKN